MRGIKNLQHISTQKSIHRPPPTPARPQQCFLHILKLQYQLFTARKRSLGQCNIFASVCLFAVRYGQHAGGTHPTGMHSCLF